MRSSNGPGFNLRRRLRWVSLSLGGLLALAFLGRPDGLHREDACCGTTSATPSEAGERDDAAIAPGIGETTGVSSKAAAVSNPEDHLRCAEERIRLAGAQMAHNRGDASEADRYREMSAAFRRECPFNADAMGPADREISDARRRELQSEGWRLFRD